MLTPSRQRNGSADVPDDSRRPLPRAARDALRAAEDVLRQLHDGEAEGHAHADYAAATVRAFEAVKRERPGASVGSRETVDYAPILAGNIARARGASGFTQAALAESMARVGFPWKRITVAEVERGVRRVSLDELVGLAALFGKPIVEFLLPQSDLDYQLPSGRTLPAAMLLELVFGEQWRAAFNAVKQGGGAEWSVAAFAAGAPLAGDEDWRPAAATRWPERMADAAGWMDDVAAAVNDAAAEDADKGASR
jgi:transcriptional regulator with XRE-family HTH domain